IKDEAYGTDWINSTTIQARRSGPRVSNVVECETPQAESHKPSIITISLRAAPSAWVTRAESAFFGVRKKGSPRVNSPFSTARPMVCVNANPAIAAAAVCRKLAPTLTRYRCTSFASLKVNSESGSTEYVSSGGSIWRGKDTIAADQASAAM